MRLIDAYALKNNRERNHLEGERIFFENEIDDAPTIQATVLVTITDAFANSMPGYYDKQRELIFTPCGIIPTEKAFKKGYKIIEEEEQQRGEI